MNDPLIGTQCKVIRCRKTWSTNTALAVALGVAKDPQWVQHESPSNGDSGIVRARIASWNGPGGDGEAAVAIFVPARSRVYTIGEAGLVYEKQGSQGSDGAMNDPLIGTQCKVIRCRKTWSTNTALAVALGVAKDPQWVQHESPSNGDSGIVRARIASWNGPGGDGEAAVAIFVPARSRVYTIGEAGLVYEKQGSQGSDGAMNDPLIGTQCKVIRCRKTWSTNTALAVALGVAKDPQWVQHESPSNGDSGIVRARIASWNGPGGDGEAAVAIFVPARSRVYTIGEAGLVYEKQGSQGSDGAMNDPLIGTQCKVIRCRKTWSTNTALAVALGVAKDPQWVQHESPSNGDSGIVRARIASWNGPGGDGEAAVAIFVPARSRVYTIGEAGLVYEKQGSQGSDGAMNDPLIGTQCKVVRCRKTWSTNTALAVALGVAKDPQWVQHESPSNGDSGIVRARIASWNGPGGDGEAAVAIFVPARSPVYTIGEAGLVYEKQGSQGSDGAMNDPLIGTQCKVVRCRKTWSTNTALAVALGVAKDPQWVQHESPSNGDSGIVRARIASWNGPGGDGEAAVAIFVPARSRVYTIGEAGLVYEKQGSQGSDGAMNDPLIGTQCKVIRCRKTWSTNTALAVALGVAKDPQWVQHESPSNGDSGIVRARIASWNGPGGDGEAAVAIFVPARSRVYTIGEAGLVYEKQGSQGSDGAMNDPLIGTQCKVVRCRKTWSTNTALAVALGVAKDPQWVQHESPSNGDSGIVRARIASWNGPGGDGEAAVAIFVPARSRVYTIGEAGLVYEKQGSQGSDGAMNDPLIGTQCKVIRCRKTWSTNTALAVALGVAKDPQWVQHESPSNGDSGIVRARIASWNGPGGDGEAAVAIFVPAGSRVYTIGEAGLMYEKQEKAAA